MQGAKNTWSAGKKMWQSFKSGEMYMSGHNIKAYWHILLAAFCMVGILAIGIFGQNGINVGMGFKLGAFICLSVYIWLLFTTVYFYFKKDASSSKRREKILTALFFVVMLIGFVLVLPFLLAYILVQLIFGGIFKFKATIQNPMSLVVIIMSFLFGLLIIFSLILEMLPWVAQSNWPLLQEKELVTLLTMLMVVLMLPILRAILPRIFLLKEDTEGRRQMREEILVMYYMMFFVLAFVRQLGWGNLPDGDFYKMLIEGGYSASAVVTLITKISGARQSFAKEGAAK